MMMQKNTGYWNPCPYCFVSPSELRDNGKNCESGLSCDKWSSMHTSKSRVLNSFGHLREDYEKYIGLGKELFFSIKILNLLTTFPIFRK